LKTTAVEEDYHPNTDSIKGLTHFKICYVQAVADSGTSPATHYELADCLPKLFRNSYTIVF